MGKKVSNPPPPLGVDERPAPPLRRPPRQWLANYTKRRPKIMHTVEFKFVPGDKVKDIVTGYVGIITSGTIYINNCVSYSVQSPMQEDGTVPKRQFVDEAQLELVDAVLVVEESSPSGGGEPPETGPEMPLMDLSVPDGQDSI